MTLSLETPIIDLSLHKIANLTAPAARKLAVALAPTAGKQVDEVRVIDLLQYFPMRYEDRSNFGSIDTLEEGAETAVELYVRNSGGQRVGKFRDRKKPPLFIFEIDCGDRERRLEHVKVKWFVSGRNAADIVSWYTGKFTRGTRFVAYGRWERDNRGQLQLMVGKPDEIEILPSEPAADDLGLLAAPPKEPDVQPSGTADLEENISDPMLAAIHVGRVPIYRKLGTFLTKRLREIVRGVLDALDSDAFGDDLPLEMLERNALVPLSTAIREIHFPPDGVSISDYEVFRSPAQRRLIFDEFFWLAFSMRLLKGERQTEPKGTVIEIGESTRDRLKDLLPFALTNAQKRVVGEIFADLKGDAPMNRLIQGDVGSGKTIVAFLAMMAAMENGYQTVLMAPTEILAEQHFRNAERIFEESGYRLASLLGSTKAAPKRKIHEALAAGEIDMLIGTHAVIQETVSFDRLGLAVIDEQHRFGVLQRARLKEMGRNPDILVMTATPIPRSLAMTVYGDLDVSIIDELPPGRTPIKTVVCGEDKRDGVYRGIEREVAKGRQAYVVYPLIQESEKSDLKAATAMYEDLRTRVFPNMSVGLLHGRLKSDEKEAVMAEFVAGRTNVLVSTTVIEVGVDVSNASLMIIEHAERFGLSQLHQLRGRVGRGSDESFCVLLTGDKKTTVARERLGIMEETSDGFKIAEKDLELRGQGEILGTRQSGLESFKIANIVRDLDILAAARDAVELYLGPRRDDPETSRLKQLAKRHKNVGLGSVG